MIIGQYVKTFAEADMGMLEGASLNAPYPFHWVYIDKVEPEKIICRGGRQTLTLPYKSTRNGDRAYVEIKDPIFGRIMFKVAPFKRTERQ